MCGRFSLQIDPEILANIFGLMEIPAYSPKYNIAPAQQILTIRRTDASIRSSFMHWGLIPSWAKDISIGSRMTNARSESVHEKPAFRYAIRLRRCIIPAGGFFEWREEFGKKEPFYIRMKNDAVMGFAGIWDQWKNPEGEIVESCLILTTTSNPLIQPLHNRMPVILHREEYGLWLDKEVTDPEKLKHLYQPYPADLMEMNPDFPLVNSLRNDIPDLTNLLCS